MTVFFSFPFNFIRGKYMLVVVVVVVSSQSVRDFNSAESVRYNLEDFYRRHVCVELL
jgi:hypothetical protein